ncbi:MAG: radical SAM protein [Deltaproteobacteria bacterium]|jgi:MoaA/NifB/PqqE/SkfB family radical SAM enzyme|nr:radical SAM protein [Deltaproteobacteria bacterium]MBW2535060.1 radical SAM protein [Deltaproteobacteria bacterium]
MTGNSRAGGQHAAGAKVEDHHRTKGLLRLTMACSERCTFCNVPVEQLGGPDPTEAELDQQLATFVDSGQRTLTISGGEPTLRKQALLELIARARSRGIEFVELQTTAARIDRELAAALARAGLTSAFVPLLSQEARIHDELMGRPGAFAEGLEGIDALIDAGVQVTLNVVLTRPTQSSVVPIVELVAERLTAVRSISLSAVQPHGRAATQLELLPDYAELGPEVRRAQLVAKRLGIELLNPYCGLPLCVGWEGDRERCVEALEAEQLRGRASASVPGLVNRGDKLQGAPCRTCAWRTRCGGAWRAYWTVRGGRGLCPIDRRVEPWEEGAWTASAQTVVECSDMPTDAALESIGRAATPTVWLRCKRLEPGDGARLVAAGCTDLALHLEASAWCEAAATQHELRSLAERNRSLPPQAVLRTLLVLEPRGTFESRYRALQAAASVGVETVRVQAPARSRPRFERFVAAARRELYDLDLSLAIVGDKAGGS